MNVFFWNEKENIESFFFCELRGNHVVAEEYENCKRNFFDGRCKNLPPVCEAILKIPNNRKKNKRM